MHSWHAGSEIAGEAAAALAAASLSRASPTSDYLTPAAQLYTFATGPAKGSYMNTSSLGIQIHAALYPSTVSFHWGPHDCQCWNPVFWGMICGML